MPCATRRKAAVLNKAYANLVSKSFAEAADALRDRMVEKMSFGEEEAAANIELQSHLAGDDAGGLWGERRRSLPSTKVAVTVDAVVVAAVRAAAPERVSVAEGPDGTATITVTGFLREAEKVAVYAALPEDLSRFCGKDAGRPVARGRV